MGRPRKHPQGKIYVANQSFATEVDGVPTIFTAGITKVREGHPILNGRKMLFDEIEVDYEWEQATDAPGEQRGRTYETAGGTGLQT